MEIGDSDVPSTMVGAPKESEEKVVVSRILRAKPQTNYRNIVSIFNTFAGCAVVAVQAIRFQRGPGIANAEDRGSRQCGNRRPLDAEALVGMP